MLLLSDSFFFGMQGSVARGGFGLLGLRPFHLEGSRASLHSHLGHVQARLTVTAFNTWSPPEPELSGTAPCKGPKATDFRLPAAALVRV